jgi:Zn-dependent peptidase ImmA (M78 family)
MSLRELEAKIDKVVSAQAIGKYERDEMMPGSDVLAAIARAVRVSESYLLGQNELTLESVEFRKNKITSRKEEASIKASVLGAVERYLEIEDFVGVSSAKWSKPQGAPYHVAESGDAENAANRLRGSWALGFGPIPNLVEFLEEQGIKVIPLKFGDEVSGLMCFARRSKGEDVPVIIVNQTDTGERQRFTLARELGHLVLETPGGAKGEKLAHWFAGAFLMTDEILWREVGKHRDSLSIGELVELKMLFKVSIQTITCRLKDLGIIGEPLFKRLFDEFERRGWRKPPYAEPGAIGPEKPERFTRLCYRAVSEGAISEAKGAELLGITVRDVGRRLDLE